GLRYPGPDPRALLVSDGARRTTSADRRRDRAPVRGVAGSQRPRRATRGREAALQPPRRVVPADTDAAGTPLAFLNAHVHWTRLPCVPLIAACQPAARVAPTSATPWRPPGPLEHYLPAAAAAHTPTGVVPEPGRIYALVDLIDLAERANPETQRAWER